MSYLEAVKSILSFSFISLADSLDNQIEEHKEKTVKRYLSTANIIKRSRA